VFFRSLLAETIAGLEAHPPSITGEYVQLVSLYAKYLGDAGEKQESRHFRAATVYRVAFDKVIPERVLR
jgi:hypothetical protein